MKRFPILLTLVIFFCCQNGLCQSHELESQLTTTPDIENLRILHQLVDHYAPRDSAKALNFASQAIAMSESINDKFHLGKSYLDMAYAHQESFQYEKAQQWLENAETTFSGLKSNIGLGLVAEARGLALVKQGYHDKSINMFKNALEHFEAKSDTSKIDRTFYNIGYAHYRLRNYDSAIFYFYKILPKCNQDFAKICVDVYNQLGTTYTEIQEYKKANDYLTLALEGSLQRKDSVSAANATMNLAGNYFFQQNLDSCVFFLGKAIEIYDQTGNRQGQVIGLNNLSIIYEENGELNKSLSTAFKAVEAAKKINDRNIIAGSYLQIMDLNHKLGDIGVSLYYSDSALAIIRELKSKYHFQQYYQSLAEAYTSLKDFKKAMEFRELYHAYSDSMVNEQKNKQIAELETRYETEKKEQQIALLNTQNQLQAAIIQRKNFTMTSIAVILGVTLLFGYLFIRQKTLKARAQLEKEKSRLKSEQIKAVILSQEKERKRFAMDLHDDFGQQISALKLYVSKFKEHSRQDEITEKSEEILDTMYTSLKTIAFDLMPHTLFQKGLEEAIVELKEQINATGKMKINFHPFDIGDRIGDDQKVAVYRIVQEIVSNIIKYSDATKIDINITNLGDRLSLLIEDNGTGFDINQFKNGRGNGWKNIHSRLDLLHGEIEFDTMPGRKNTTVSIEIPFEIKEATVA